MYMFWYISKMIQAEALTGLLCLMWSLSPLLLSLFLQLPFK